MSSKNKDYKKVGEKEEIPAEKAESKEITAELKTAQTKNLSLNSESKGFGTKQHLEDIKKRQAEGCEVSLDEENLLSNPPA